ncbi:AAEL006497-PA [Aedes aegypti]|uniref:AAEL006497-PA n=1 Tax=Aedes aegypti TaxID=7159 RepID=Q175W4_AEDAE|nr:AAEL006497-PA [Aedes aegypti]
MASIDLEDPDLLLARQLQEQFDREAVEISSGEEEEQPINISDDYQLAVELQQRYNDEAVELSDEDDDVLLSVELPATSENVPTRTPKRRSSSVVQQEPDYEALAAPEMKLFRAERVDLNAAEYFIEELQTYVDPENNFEWKFVEVMPDLKAIFLRLDELIFQSRFKPKHFNVIWSQAIGRECTNRNFNDVNGRYTIALNETLLVLRPRIEIISVLLVSLADV